MKIHLTQYHRNINKIYDLNFQVIFILKNITSLFQKKYNLKKYLRNK
jgi:hypothetical protein